MEKLLTSIFGETCFFCGEPGRLICYSCESKIRLCQNGVCILCQNKTVLGYSHTACQSGIFNSRVPTQLCSVYEYGGYASQVVKKSKYKPKRFALLRLLSSSGAKLASKLGFDFPGFVVVPIPISKSREKDRGFNQAEIIAKAICKEFNLLMDSKLVIRAKDTSKQFGLQKEARAVNIAGAFVASNRAQGGRFLLVDDICTTGATLIEASRALYAVGALDVRCFSLLRKI